MYHVNSQTIVSLQVCYFLRYFAVERKLDELYLHLHRDKTINNPLLSDGQSFRRVHACLCVYIMTKVTIYKKKMYMARLHYTQYLIRPSVCCI